MATLKANTRQKSKQHIVASFVLLIVSANSHATAQLVPLPGLADGDRQKRITNIMTELSTSPSGEAGKLVPSLLDSLSSIETRQMYDVYQKMQGIMADPSVIDALVQGLKTDKAKIAAQLLANSRHQVDFTTAQIQDLILATGSDSAEVRTSISQILGSILLPTDNSPQTALIRLMRSDPVPSVRTAAANSLSTLAREVYFKNASQIAEAYANSLANDNSQQVRIAAASGLSQMAAKAAAAAPVLRKSLCDNSSQVRSQVLQSIINIGEPCSGCLDELIDMFNGPSDRYNNITKERIVQAFGAIGPAAAKAVPLITPLLKDKSSALNAAQALAKIGPAAASATSELIIMLESPYMHNREAAARALGSIGSKAKAAVPALKKALKDERNAGEQRNDTWYKQTCQETIREAIFKISGEYESAPAS